MKKKVLTTAAALAMLAPTMTSFASSTLVGQNQTHSENENNSINATVGVGGEVRNKNNVAPAGKIEVSLPSTLSFVVNPDGTVQTPTAITVTNNSASANIVVSVAGFSDSTPDDGTNITVMNYDTLSSNLSSKDRSYVGLKLGGTYGGQQQSVNLEHDKVSPTPILNVTAQQTANLTLQGIAGTKELGTTGSYTGVDETGTSDNFTITFQIKKDK